MDEVIEKEITTKENVIEYIEAVSGRIFSRRVMSFEDELPFDVVSQKWKECHLDELADLVTDGAHASPKTVENGKKGHFQLTGNQ